jgi:hypothetical protein
MPTLPLRKVSVQNWPIWRMSYCDKLHELTQALIYACSQYLQPNEINRSPEPAF